MSVLEETKGKFKVEGKVSGITNENAKREGYTQAGKPYKTITFFVETSESNKVKVELFGQERDEVVAYNQKEKDKKKASKKVKWSKRHDDHGDFKVMGTSLQIEPNQKGDGYIRKVLVELDAIDYIASHLKDGDFVRVNGRPDFQEYENQQGETKQSTRFNITSITRIDDIDFKAEDFKEVAIFEQDIVVIDKIIDEESKKLIVNAKIIKYGGEHVDTTFVVDAERLPKLANNMAKRFNFGDFIKTFGLIVNSVVVTEDTAPVEDEDDWGGDDEIKNDFNTNYIRDYINELQITSVDSSTYEAKKYNEEDFISEEEDTFNGDISNDDNDSFDDDEEDLPFA